MSEEEKEKASAGENPSCADKAECKKDGEAECEKGNESKSESECNKEGAGKDGGEKEKTSEGEASEEQKALTAEEQLTALKKENEQLKDQLLRKAADFDNYRKRMIKEKADAYTYANENLLCDLLESLDNFERAALAGKGVPQAKALYDGVEMANKALVSMLENKYNLTSFAKAGDEFDPALHEGLKSTEGDVDAPKLEEVYLKGYKLHDKVIRHAKVAVVTPKAAK